MQGEFACLHRGHDDYDGVFWFFLFFLFVHRFVDFEILSKMPGVAAFSSTDQNAREGERETD